MNRWIFTLLTLVFALGMKGQKYIYTPEDSALVVKLLREAKTERGTESRILYFGKKFIGFPVVDQSQPQKNQGNPDNQEYIYMNLTKPNCTTFIHTLVALSLCDRQNQRTFKDYCKNLTKVLFREGKKPNQLSRLYYFTWWAEDNEKKGILRDIAPKSEPWGPFTAVQTANINYMSSHPELYKDLNDYPQFMATIKKYEGATNGRKFRYIPKKNIAWDKTSTLNMVKDGDIVGMVTNKPGLDVCHLGIVCWQNGKLYLLHASSLYKKVLMSKESYYIYEMKQPSHLGIRVFRFKDI